MKGVATINLVTPRDIAGQDGGRTIMGCIAEAVPWLAAGKYGLNDPLKEVLDLKSGDYLKVWGHHSFHWAAKPRYSAVVFYGNKFNHSTIAITVYSRLAGTETELMLLFDRLSFELGIHFGYFHYFGLEEQQSENRRFARLALQSVVSTPHLVRGIPEVMAITVFGAPYVQMFGLETLLTTPAYEVRAVGDKLVRLQLVPSAELAMGQFEQLEKARFRARTHLGIDAFLSDEGEMAARWPAFGLEIPPAWRSETLVDRIRRGQMKAP